jgi:hypothetical protein
MCMKKSEIQRVIDAYYIGKILDYVEKQDGVFEVTTNSGRYYLKSYTVEEYLDGKPQIEEIELVPIKIGNPTLDNSFIVHKYGKYWRVWSRGSYFN